MNTEKKSTYELKMNFQKSDMELRERGGTKERGRRRGCRKKEETISQSPSIFDNFLLKKENGHGSALKQDPYITSEKTLETSCVTRLAPESQLLNWQLRMSPLRVPLATKSYVTTMKTHGYHSQHPKPQHVQLSFCGKAEKGKCTACVK